MRRLAPLCLALLGAGLARPAAAQPGPSADCPSCAAGAAMPGYAGGPGFAPGPDTSRHSHPHTRRCPKCQLDRAQRQAGHNQLIVTGPDGGPSGDVPCVSCAGGPGMVIMGEAPGLAMLGPGTRSVVSPEPAPIGVVQAGFRPGAGAAGMPPGGAMTMARPGYGMMPGHPGGPMVPPAQTPVGGGRHRRTSVLGHLFGLDGFGHMGDGRRARAASTHAATRVGNLGTAPMSEIPASFVYGR